MNAEMQLALSLFRGPRVTVAVSRAKRQPLAVGILVHLSSKVKHLDEVIIVCIDSNV